MLSRLMSGRRFAPLFWSQFCSALNDNFLKNALGMLVLFGIGTTAAFDPADGAKLNTLAGVVFIAPFFFLSALGGELADKFDKGMIAAAIKLGEMPVAALAAAGFYFHSVPVLFGALFSFGVIGALFGPVKYGLLPEALKTEELASGNALVEGATFFAILLGTIGGGIAVTEAQSSELIVAIILGLAIVCWLSATMIPRCGPAAPEITITRNPLSSTFRLLAELKAEPRMRVGAHVCSWFWLVGAMALSLMPVMVKGPMGGTSGVYTLALSTFVIGIALGSLMAARASRSRPNLSLVPFGAALMGAGALLLAALALVIVRPMADIPVADFVGSKRGITFMVSLFLMAAGGGLFIVPAFAAVQSWAPADRRARIVAAVNVMNAAYMTVAGAVLAILQLLDTPLCVLFSLLGVATLTVAFLIARFWGQEASGIAGAASFNSPQS